MSQGRLPNLIIAGVNKAGTTSLFYYLKQHPQVAASSIKETFYYAPLIWGEEKADLSHYRRYFEHCSNEQVVLESTPRYLHGGAKLARAIKEDLGDIRIVMLLREPISRLYSFFSFKKRSLEIEKELSFSEFVNQCLTCSYDQPPKGDLQRNYLAIEDGFYAKYLEQWYGVFGDHLKVLFFDDLKKDPKQLTRELLEWLQLDLSFIEGINFESENKSIDYSNRRLHAIAIKAFRSAEHFFTANPKFKRTLRNLYYSINGGQFDREIDDETRSKLYAIYAPHNQELARLLAERGVKGMPEWLCSTGKSR